MCNKFLKNNSQNHYSLQSYLIDLGSVQAQIYFFWKGHIRHCSQLLIDLAILTMSSLAQVIRILKSIFARHGAPEVLSLALIHS